MKVLIQFGILIGELTERNSRVFMYHVEDFYVETKYTAENDDLVSIHSFSETEREDHVQWTILNAIAFRKGGYTD